MKKIRVPRSWSDGGGVDRRDVIPRECSIYEPCSPTQDSDVPEEEGLPDGEMNEIPETTKHEKKEEMNMKK